MIKFFIILLIILGVIAIVHFTLTMIYFPSNSKFIRKEILEATIQFLSNSQEIKDKVGTDLSFVRQQLSVMYIKKIPQEAECEILVKSNTQKIVFKVMLSFNKDENAWEVISYKDISHEYKMK
jgi:hypothetical protein